MPLKNPNEIPKIPKARKKKMDNVIASEISELKPDRLEYNILAYFDYNKDEEKQYVTFAIETEKEFTSFAYELSCDFVQERNIVNILLLGLKAKTNAVPFIQPARTEVPIEDLNGEYTINVYKQDGAVNSAKYYMNFFKKEIVIKETFIPEKKNNRHFCDFHVDEDSFTFAEEK